MVNVEINSREEIIIHELINRIYGKSDLFYIITKRDVHPSDLEQIYNLLIQNGAGIYKNDVFIAAKALVDPVTLDLICKNYKGGNFKYADSDPLTSAYLITNQVIHYFQNK